MDPAQQTAADYYKHHKKRSFFSRLTIISSMAILLIVLAVNISALNSQQTTKSHAATPEQVEKLLPSLPPGCIYQHENGKIKVDCQKPTPTIAAIVPINVDLPKLPPECSFETTTVGSKIQCSSATTPIPTTEVSLPASCIGITPDKSAICKNAEGQTVTVQLPSLPEGCSYSRNSDHYFVVCATK